MLNHWEQAQGNNKKHIKVIYQIHLLPVASGQWTRIMLQSLRATARNFYVDLPEG
jgi:hypothetical protein